MQINIYPPGDAETRADLARRIAAVHADAVLSRLRSLQAAPAERREALRLIREERDQAGR